jgi:hypothetical protein
MGGTGKFAGIQGLYNSSVKNFAFRVLIHLDHTGVLSLVLHNWMKMRLLM